jgi:hypothetical protein
MTIASGAFIVFYRSGNTIRAQTVASHFDWHAVFGVASIGLAW